MKALLIMVMIALTSCAPKTDNIVPSPVSPAPQPTPQPIPQPTPSPRVGPNPVSFTTTTSTDPKMSSNYTIIASAGITTTPGTTIVGNIAVSPITGGSMTGFGLTMDASNQFSTSSMISGRVFAADYATPTPDNLSSAVASMNVAYNDAYGRTNPNYIDLGAGNISGMTLTPGLYSWSSGLIMNGEVIIRGGVNDVIILQIAKTINLGTNAKITLTGGIQAKNVVFAAAEAVTLAVGSHFEGILLCKTGVVVQTSAAIYGRIYAGTAVTLDNNVIVQK